MFLNDNVSGAVIAVPAFFNDAQRKATKDAARIAGLEVKYLISSSTAAALAYAFGKEAEGKLLVFDFGGGTLDITILEISNGVFEVITNNCDIRLGGIDMDQLLVDYLVDDFLECQGIDLSCDPIAMMRLREEAEKARIELSMSTAAELNLRFIASTSLGFEDLCKTIFRKKLEEMISPILSRCRTIIDTALNDAEMTRNEIDQIIMVGGLTRMTCVQNLLKEYFGKDPIRYVDPMESMAMGSSILAGIIGGEVKDYLLLDATPFSFGIETSGGVMTTIIPRNTTIPNKKSYILSPVTVNQGTLDIHVLQGECKMAGNNISLARFEFTGIPDAPCDVPQIVVTFDIDSMHILRVHVIDLGSGREKSVTITGNSGLSEKDIDYMINEAKKYASGDES